MDLSELAEPGLELPQYLSPIPSISRFLRKFRELKNCFQTGVGGNDREKHKRDKSDIRPMSTEIAKMTYMLLKLF